jgi:preprotein translocase subunit SecA
MRYVERRMMLGAIDRQWVEYLTGMDELRQTISLQAYAQRDPLVEFKRRSFDMFDELKSNITHDIVYQIIPASFQYEEYLEQIRIEQEQRIAAAQRASVAATEQARQARTVRKTVQMPGRNDLCPCGSGKKFKHCHMGREDEIRHLLQNGAPRMSEQLAYAAASANGGKSADRQAAVSTSNAGEPTQASQSTPAKTKAEKSTKATPAQTQPTPRGRSAPPANQATPPRGKGSSKRGKKKTKA